MSFRGKALGVGAGDDLKAVTIGGKLVWLDRQWLVKVIHILDC